MKTLIVALVLSGMAATQASAAPASCGQLIEAKAKLAAQVEYMKEKINNANNSDVLDLYMDQYEDLYARLLNVDSKIENNCK